MATETFVTDVAFGEDVITTTVTSSGAAVEGWLQEIRSVYRRFLRNLVVGLDVEWRPSYSPAQNPVALLQLCVGRRCLIFQLLHADFVPQALAGFLTNPDFRFVGVGVQEDVERLSDDHGLEVANTVDLRSLAAEGMHMPELRQAGLQTVARTVMGANLQKPRRVRMGPWDAYCLSHEQIKYACIDAFVSFQVGRKLLSGDGGRERSIQSMATETVVIDVAFGEDVITTTVTSSGAAVKGWLKNIRFVYRWFLRDLVVGLDVEWRPSYSPAQNPVALLQLCVGRRCLIFQLLHADFVPQALAGFLTNPDFRFVGVGVQEDVERLSDDHGLEVANTVDLRGLAAEGMHMPELRQAGLQAVARTVIGANLQKPRMVTMGPWDACCLSDEQVKYACIDAFVSFEVGRKLLTGDY